MPSGDLQLGTLEPSLFSVYDEVHSDFGPPPREFAINDAIRQLRRRAVVPWNREPNPAPCTVAECKRRWVLLGESAASWKVPIWVEVSRAGVKRPRRSSFGEWSRHHAPRGALGLPQSPIRIPGARVP
jgi:hypothetical protein